MSDSSGTYPYEWRLLPYMRRPPSTPCHIYVCGFLFLVAACPRPRVPLRGKLLLCEVQQRGDGSNLGQTTPLDLVPSFEQWPVLLGQVLAELQEGIFKVELAQIV